jgi:hypothetical protein
MNLRIKIARGYLTVVGIYSSEEGKREESNEFYKTRSKTYGYNKQKLYFVVAGDFNARIG